MRSRLGRRLVLATETSNGDVIANDIFVRVDAELEETRSALKTASVLVHRVHNLLWARHDAVSGSEVEGSAMLGSVFLVKVDEVVKNGAGLDESNEAEKSEFHLVDVVLALKRLTGGKSAEG